MNALLLFLLVLVNYNRVILNALPGVENSDYINASYIEVSSKLGLFNNMTWLLSIIQGFRRKKVYIAAQGNYLIEW